MTLVDVEQIGMKFLVYITDNQERLSFREGRKESCMVETDSN